MRIRALAICCVALTAHAAVAALPPFRLSPGEYIPVSEIRPGMTGYGLTVFQGVKIEKFGVRVVAVMPQQNAGRPLVLVMMSGGPITKRHANIIAGMSGSPVYINGRLLGAVAYGDSLPKEPLAMITPIEDMVDSFDPKLPSRPSFSAAPGATPLQPMDTGLTGLSPNRLLPVFASGFGARSLATLNEWLKPYGIQAMSGPGGGGGGALPSYFPRNVRLEPGSAIAVSLCQGDVDVTAIGTVTYRRGDRILAFGHPFLQVGPAEFPASTAYIHDVFSSVSRSYKLGSPIETVGTIQQDQPFSVGGLLHRLPHMIPVTVHVADQSTGRKRDYHMRLVNHPLLAPGLVVSGAQEVIDRLRAFPGDAMATVSFTVQPVGLAPITRTNVVYDSGSISASSLSEVLETMAILSRNPFQPVPIKSVDMSINIRGGHDTATVERAWIEKDKVEPGDTVVIQAVVKPYRKPAETHTVRLKIPENAPNGQAQVVVFGGQTGYGRITAGAAPSGSTPMAASASVSNVKQLIQKFSERERNNELGVRILMPGTVVTVDGQRFSNLPDPLAEVMKSTKASSTRLERDELRATQTLPYVIAGQQMLLVNIERKNVVEKSSGTTTASTTASASSSDTSDDSSSSTSVMAIGGSDDEALADGGIHLEPFDAPPAKPDEKKPDAKPETKPAETKPTDAKATDAKPTDAKPAETKPEEADANKDAKGPGRLAAVWKESSKSQFETGDLTNVTVTSDGDVRLTPRLSRVADTGRPIVWSVLPLPDGTTLAATGNGGEVLKVSADGKATVVAKTDELEVQALARDSRGNLYAGTSPHGRVLRIEPSGKATPLFDTGERYVFALLAADDGTLYAATGPNGKLFAISPDGKGTEFKHLPETHVLSLARCKDGSILAGTSPDGIVYRITPKGEATVVFDAPEPNVTAVAENPAGGVFVSTAPSGKIYRVLADGRPEVLLDKPDGSVLSLAVGPDGRLYAGGGKKIYCISADKTVATFDNEDQNQIVSVAVANDGTLRAGSANTGVVYRSEAEKTGTFSSPVRDADPHAAWGRMEWQADVPTGARLDIQTRSGGVAQPDSTWSAWSPVLASAAGSQVTSPSARFIQYRATFAASPDGQSPSLRLVSMRYLTDNRPPTVRLTEPKDGDRLGGKETVKWTGSDPDSDLLNYVLYLSSDNGGTWKALNTAVKESEKPAPKPEEPKTEDAAAKAKREARDAETVKQVNAELDKYPDMAADIKTAIQQNVTTALKPGPKDALAAEVSNGDNTKATYSWDTTTTPDGPYRLKIVATDKASNPASPLTAEDVSRTIYVINAKPTVTIADKDPKAAADLTVALSGDATTTMAGIVRVSYRIDKGVWQSAIASDGIFDSPSEKWKLTTDPLTKGEHAIEVRATDEVDNSGSSSVKVTVG